MSLMAMNITGQLENAIVLLLTPFNTEMVKEILIMFHQHYKVVKLTMAMLFMKISSQQDSRKTKDLW